MTRPIFFLSDFGAADTYVGVVKAVMLSIAPDAQLVDLTHEIPPQDVRAGAFALMTAVPYLPVDAVVLAVVDPGVGTERRGIAVEAGGRLFVGPDNGLFSWVIGTDHEAVILDRPAFWLPDVSATFHGRDVFGPVAAHLARGWPLAEIGSSTAPVVSQLFPQPAIQTTPDGRIRSAVGSVVHVDRFGNLISNLRADDLPSHPHITIAERTVSGISPHYQTSQDGQLIALIGSAGLLEIAVPNGSAAARLRVGVGETVTASSGHPYAAADAVAPPTA